ncbi:MAG: hypothetical protein ACRD03_15050 [Acidimicrobiales bacterium]
MDEPTARVRMVDGRPVVEVDISPPADPDVLVPLSPADEGDDVANPPRSQPERWIGLAGG